MATEVEPGQLDGGSNGYRSAPWLRPPRLRIVNEDEQRRSTWLELFFDLVFVAAVAQVAADLYRDHSAGGFLRYAGLFVPVVWSWMGFTFYANRFDTDDLIHRLMATLGMLATAALAVTVDNATTGGGTAFVLAYVSGRLVLVALYARAYRHVPEARPAIRNFIIGFTTSGAIWVLSLAADAPARYWIWVMAMAIELSVPLFAWRTLGSAPVNREHIEERFGLFTIIVLGEGVIAVVAGTDAAGWRTASSVVAAAGFIATVCLWWIYFDLADTSIIRRGLLGLVYVYAHFPLFAGAAASGVGIKLAIHASAAHEHLDAGTRWALCGGIAAFLLSLALFHVATRSRQGAIVALTRVLAAAALAAAAAFGGGIEPLVLLLGIAFLLVAEVVFEARVSRGNPMGCDPSELYQADRELPVLTLELAAPAEPDR